MFYLFSSYIILRGKGADESSSIAQTACRLLSSSFGLFPPGVATAGGKVLDLKKKCSALSLRRVSTPDLFLTQPRLMLADLGHRRRQEGMTGINFAKAAAFQTTLSINDFHLPSTCTACTRDI